MGYVVEFCMTTVDAQSSSLRRPEGARVSVEVPVGAGQLYGTTDQFVCPRFLVEADVGEPDVVDVAGVGQVGDLFTIGRPEGLADVSATGMMKSPMWVLLMRWMYAI